ncbi:ribosomal-protein-alanine N-acetyltransferase [Sporotomaculum syntrophicum]|uniref:Ribosomal-protein-alanine N-acetyltransferase n=1 Tax=Sporotomaculum syntrophicum TaxID=182264 RepID=A0A9D2WQY0_9FIRM|nr:ribosomal protein S18-alanine N-acetyltransferase [Sporotomaculum syntrophicum]KAF1085458.1 ribosomal-protein-alanine N-acetyltransferase [Sporotomaculum syntrophicum]
MNKAASLANITFAQMQFNHLDQVIQIEKVSFPTPWSKNAFDYELRSNEFAHYIVALAEDQEVVGYAGIWVIIDEAHVTNIAVRQDYRGYGLGMALMLQLIQRATVLGVQRMTLEVRPSNAPARALYARLGFKDYGRRKNYYPDTNEDAIIMWKNDLG